MATTIEEDFISYAELADIFPDVTKSDWNILAEGVGAFPVRRCPDDPYFNPRNRQILGFVNLDLDEMERIYRFFDDPEALTPEEKEEKYNPFLRFGAISLSEISRRNRIGVKKLKSVLADLGITPSQYYFGNNLPGKGLDRTQYSLIRPYLKHHRRMLPSKKVKSIKSWAAILRLDEDTLYARAREAGIDPKTYIFHGMPAYGLRRNEIKTIFEVFPDLERRLNVPLAKQTDMPITRIATGAGMDLRTLRNLMHDAEITPVDRMYPNGKVGETLTKQQRSALCLTYLKLMEQ